MFTFKCMFISSLQYAIVVCYCDTPEGPPILAFLAGR